MSEGVAKNDIKERQDGKTLNVSLISGSWGEHDNDFLYAWTDSGLHIFITGISSQCFTIPFSSTVTCERFLSLRYLKPDVHKKSKHKTAVIKKTLNPEFNEVDLLVYVHVHKLLEREAHLQRLNVKRQFI